MSGKENLPVDLEHFVEQKTVGVWRTLLKKFSIVYASIGFRGESS